MNPRNPLGRISLLACVLASTVPANAVQATGHSSTQDATSDPAPFRTERVEQDATVVAFDAGALGRVQEAGSPLTIRDFVLPGGEAVDLELERFHVTGPNTRFVIGRNGGPDVPFKFDHQAILLFRGRVLDRPGSHVFLSVSPWGSTGSISLSAGKPQYRISSRGGGQVQLRADQLVVFPATASPDPFPGPYCGVDTDSDPFSAPPPPEGLPIRGLRQIELAIETDYEYFTLFGDLTAAAAYVTQLYAQVSDIYIRDANARIDLTFVRLWDHPGDLFNGPDPLFELRDYWEANMGHVQRDVVQFLSGRRDLPWGGIAWLGGLCNNRSYSVVAYTLGFFADPSRPHVFNRDISTTAHELGHSCNTPHTHDLGLDTCDDENSQPQRGSIMSYCGQTFTGGTSNMDLRFHAVVQLIMEEYITSRTCVVNDCNQNGIDDAIDISGGASPDVNNNGIPDECEDCNGNGVLDDEDIRTGFSPDLNGNGIPDECEPDCNGNNIPDDLDFLPSIGNILFHDNFETDMGWIVENLGATSGDWERGVPINDPNWAHDPIADSDGSGQCLLTENAPGNTDVDGGATRVTSPEIDMSAGGLTLTYDYYLKLTSSGTEDRIVLEANDGSGWTVLATHNTNGGLAWRNALIDPGVFAAAGVSQTATMRFRFTINDDNPQSIVEGGIDAVIVGAVLPPLSVDLNFNNVPDECEPDCDNDGTMDYMQIQADMSLDLNRNALLDGCEDCDGDTVTDLVELDQAHNIWIASLEHTSIREYLAKFGTLTRVSDDAAIAEGQDLLISSDRRTFVTSKLDNRVLEFDAAGSYLGNFVAPGGGGLSEPAGMTFAPSGNLLVASRNTNSVIEYDILTGGPLGDFVAPGAGGLVRPFGLAFGPNGNLFVTSSDNRVLEFDGMNGSFVRVFVSAAGNGGLAEPRGLLFLPTTGNLLVASRDTNQVLEYEAGSGAFVRQFNQGGTSNRLTLDQPWGLRLGPEGDVYVSRANIQGPGPDPLHLSNPRVYQFDVVSGFFLRAYILGVDSGILHPTGFDFIPDAGTDCNFNQVPDNCDIASGFSRDVNGNGIPDECEPGLPGGAIS